MSPSFSRAAASLPQAADLVAKVANTARLDLVRILAVAPAAVNIHESLARINGLQR
jgi:hypothetical protein